MFWEPKYKPGYRKLWEYEVKIQFNKLYLGFMRVTYAL